MVRIRHDGHGIDIKFGLSSSSLVFGFDDSDRELRDRARLKLNDIDAPRRPRTPLPCHGLGSRGGR